MHHAGLGWPASKNIIIGRMVSNALALRPSASEYSTIVSGDEAEGWQNCDFRLMREAHSTRTFSCYLSIVMNHRS